jgi:hypothetical protein
LVVCPSSEVVFAAQKDIRETRPIRPCEVLTALIDPAALDPVEYAYLPLFVLATVPKTARVLVSERDARHYFRSLGVRSDWIQWLGVSKSPRLKSWPHGSSASCMFAQGITDARAHRAALPSDRRRLLSAEMPLDLPVWGLSLMTYRRSVLMIFQIAWQIVMNGVRVWKNNGVASVLYLTVRRL